MTPPREVAQVRWGRAEFLRSQRGRESSRVLAQSAISTECYSAECYYIAQSSHLATTLAPILLVPMLMVLCEEVDLRVGVQHV